jgi:hypothetical protein
LSTSSHRECKDIIIIEDLLATSVSSTSLDNLEQTLQDVGSNLEIVIADRQNNLVELKLGNIVMIITVLLDLLNKDG